MGGIGWRYVGPVWFVGGMTDGEGRDATVADQQLLAERFEEQRTHLRAVAYRMLALTADAVGLAIVAIDVLADPERLSRLDSVAG